MHMLAEVAKKETINKMNAHNLAIVFGPNLARDSSGEDLQAMMKDTSSGSMSLFEDMIENYDQIFTGFQRAEVSTRGKRSSYSSSRSKSMLGIGRLAPIARPESCITPDTGSPMRSSGGALLTAAKATTPRSLSERESIEAKTLQIQKDKMKVNQSSKSRKTPRRRQKEKEEKAVAPQELEKSQRRSRRTFLYTKEQLHCFCCKSEISSTTETIFLDAVNRCHNQCFQCHVCSSPLDFSNFQISENHLHCESCFSRK
jgi:hypothetical protein